MNLKKRVEQFKDVLDALPNSTRLSSAKSEAEPKQFFERLKRKYRLAMIAKSWVY